MNEHREINNREEDPPRAAPHLKYIITPSANSPSSMNGWISAKELNGSLHKIDLPLLFEPLQLFDSELAVGD